MNQDDAQSFNNKYDMEDEMNKINALSLQRTLGINFALIDSIHNLTNETRKEIFYPVAHTGVIYDMENNTQKLLQGHCNKITATAYCTLEDIIVTADSGPDSMLVVWDAKTGIPKKTILDPHPNGTQALDISPNGKFIVTISKEPNVKDVQTITLWDWKSESPQLISQTIDQDIGYQNFVRFSYDNQEFVTTGDKWIGFWKKEPNEKALLFYYPSNIPQTKTLTQTVFITGITQVVTGTTDGSIIVCDISLIIEKVDTPKERRVIKTVDLMNNQNKSDPKKVQISINILKIQDNYLVIGSSNGSVRFYDFQYRIIAWFEDAKIASITNISFANTPMIQEEQSIDEEDQAQKQEQEKKFICPDFIVVDMEAKITLLNYKLFEELDDEKKKGKVIMKSIVSPIVAISCRPNHNIIGICCENGNLYEWNFQEKNSILTTLKNFEQENTLQQLGQPTCIDYSPDGNFLCIATNKGKLNFYDCQKQEWQSSILEISESDQAKPKVLMQVFSSDSKNLATIDQDYAVTLFTIDYKSFDPNNPKEWQFVGKHRVHHGEIKSIAFGESKDENGNKYYRLFSIGADMKLVEYEVIEIDVTKQKETNIKFVDRLKLKAVYPIEQECVPTACIWYPINMYKEDVLLVANEQYKLKLWQFMKNGSKICKKTCLGPTSGGAINKLLILNPNDAQNDYQDKYLAYSTKQKVVGIIKLPLEGNPNQTMGLIAHPNEITSISSTNDGKYFFTSGNSDFCVNIWKVNVQALEQIFATNPNEDPFPKLLEGGEDGPTHQDLKNFFYYSQIRSKDEHTTKARKLDDKVPLFAIPDMMRSMGYYPTLKEIENMKNEIRFSKYLDQGVEVDELDLNMFLKLFINHRPVYGIGKSQIEQSFKEITQQNDVKAEITIQDLKKILTTEGEKMTNEEFDECIKILIGENEEDVPQQINAQQFCEDLLGFEDLEAGQKDENEEAYQEDEENEEAEEDN